MFGHNDQQHSDNQPAADGSLTQDDQSLTAPQVNDTAGEFLDDITPPSTPPPITKPDTVLPDAGATLPSPAADDTADSTTAPAIVEPAVAAPALDTAAVAAPAMPTATGVTPNTDALLDIKQQALQQLTPLIGHLEQTPEEKFRTTMMMIQAADNHELLNTAYESAQQITDEKVRAQALLDIVNEINYFTHNANGGQEQQ